VSVHNVECLIYNVRVQGLRRLKKSLYAILACSLFAFKDKWLEMKYDFDRIPDRIWVEEGFWAIAIED